MAQSTTMRLRALWLQVHKWIGIGLAILIIPISITGSALVWHDWLDEQINPQRYAVTSSEARLHARRICRRRPPRDQGRRAAPARSPRSAIPKAATGRSWSSGTRPQPGDGGGRPGPHQRLARSRHRRRARQRVEQQRPRPGHARPPRLDDGSGLGPHHRRLGRRVHVHLLPHRHLALVADHRLREARLPLEAAEFDQRQHPPPGRLLDPACRSPC